jgi:Protein of unknown function (DUF726)
MSDPSAYKSPSAVLCSLPEHQRYSLASTVAVCLPEDDLSNGTWISKTLSDIVALLGLSPQAAEAFAHLTQREQQRLPVQQRTTWDDRISACCTELPTESEDRHNALRDLLVLAALLSGYDARTRVTFRRMACALELQWHPRFSCIESLLARKAHDDLVIAREKERLRSSSSSDMWRNVKIGAAAIGAGGLMAITGGLAAPAVAAGIAASGAVIGTGTITTETCIIYLLYAYTYTTFCEHVIQVLMLSLSLLLPL